MLDQQQLRKRYHECRKSKEDNRMRHVKARIEQYGYEVTSDEENNCLTFEFKGNTIYVYPYTGLFKGKGINPGRGLKKLLMQIKKF